MSNLNAPTERLEAVEEQLNFAILGSLEARRGAVSIPLGRPLHRALLAYLLINPNRVVSATGLIDALWHGEAPNTARGQVHNAISALRQLMSDPDRLTTRDHGYLFRLSNHELDLSVFESLLAQAQNAAVEAAAGLLREALALWTGDPLAGIQAPFAEPVRFRLNEQHLKAWELLADNELSRGRHHAIIPELTMLAAAHPLNERLVEKLMLALYRAGRQADALQTGRDLRNALSELQGLDPGQSFTDLELAILRAEPSLETIAVASRPKAPAQLPADLSDFTGRIDHLKSLTEMTSSQVVGLITGSAGVGKTALALRWAHERAGQFADGQLYINLHGYSDSAVIAPEMALSRFLRALEVEAERIPSNVDEAAGLYRTLLSDRRMLIVLDNAASAEQIRPLLPSGDSVVLITSRDSLHGLVARDGAFRLRLDVLSAGESQDLLRRVLSNERVEADIEAFGQIAEHCGHLPLALRISAAHLADQVDREASDYLAELQEGDRLTNFSIDGDSSANVRASFDLSHRNLREPEQRLFRLLSLVPGPDFTLDVAAALIADTASGTRRLLDRLTTAHLLQRPAPGRYSFHDLIGWYAHEHLQAHDEPDALRRLHDHYYAMADAATRLLYPQAIRLAPLATHPPFPDSAAAVSWLEGERANLVAAIKHGGADSWKLADALRLFFSLRPHPIDLTTDWPAAALAAAVADGDPRALLSAHLTFGMHHGLANPAIALTHYQIALDHATEQGWTDLIPNLLNNVGLAVDLLGDVRRAHECFAQAVEQLADGPVARRAVSLSNLGLATHYLGAQALGIEQLNQGLELYRQSGNPNGEVDALCMLGAAYLDDGHPEQALTYAHAALELLGEIGGRYYETDARNLLGAVQMSLGESKAAREAFETALEIAAETGNQLGRLTAQIGLAEVLASAPLAQAALARARELGYRLQEAGALTALATITNIREYAEQALQIQRETEYVAGQRRARALLP